MSPQLASLGQVRATYRLQFHRGFTFHDAAKLVPYLSKLGISHVYASPIMEARPGSIHGYDIIDHNRLNPELGGEEGFREIVPRLKGIGGSAGHYRVLGADSVAVEWRMSDGSTLGLIANFGTEPVTALEISGGARMLYCSGETPGAPQSATFILKPP